jgi:hypothetical protein
MDKKIEIRLGGWSGFEFEIVQSQFLASEVRKGLNNVFTIYLMICISPGCDKISGTVEKILPSSWIQKGRDRGWSSWQLINRL